MRTPFHYRYTLTLKVSWFSFVENSSFLFKWEMFSLYLIFPFTICIMLNEVLRQGNASIVVAYLQMAIFSQILYINVIGILSVFRESSK